MAHRRGTINHLRRMAVAVVFCLSAMACLGTQQAMASGPDATAPSALALTPPEVAAHGVPGASARVACAVVHHIGPCGLVSTRRAVLQDWQAEYTYVLQVGPGVYDRIAVHRVVRESQPQRPRHSTRSAFFVHGDLWGFDPAFAGALGKHDRDPNVAAYLAGANMDVWGIDQRWVLVPATVTDTALMHDWGFATQLQDMRLAMTFQRVLRGATGDGFGGTALVGWSRGSELAYAYAGLETQLPGWARNVAALVPAEGPIHYAPRDHVLTDSLCTFYAEDLASLEAGQSSVALDYLAQYGVLALTHPGRPAPDYPPYTNRVLALDVGTYPDGQVFSPWYHFVAGRLLADRTPTGLTYTPESRWFRLLTKVAPFESFATVVDGTGLFCGRVELPFDDHLIDVTVPVLEISAAGGFGATAGYSTTLVGSQDVTRLLVRLRHPGQEATDFGHVDLWQARNAPELAWAPLLRWLRTH